MTPTRVYGVDFSGGKDAGRKIWIAGGDISDGLLHIDVCQPAARLPGAGPQRERAHAALAAFILRQGPCAVGLDFPFGLPRELVDEARWQDVLRTFGDRYPDAESFRRACRDAALERTGRKELRRETDIEAKTPFSPYNLRLYRQTYYGIRDLLTPLVRSGLASVLPMQEALPGRVWVLEVCPASTLKRMQLYQPYKGRPFAPARAAILTEIERRIGITVLERLRVDLIADPEGDALDSVIAAAATFHALRGPLAHVGAGTTASLEGYVYV